RSSSAGSKDSAVRVISMVGAPQVSGPGAGNVLLVQQGRPPSGGRSLRCQTRDYAAAYWRRHHCWTSRVMTLNLSRGGAGGMQIRHAPCRCRGGDQLCGGLQALVAVHGVLPGEELDHHLLDLPVAEQA